MNLVKIEIFVQFSKTTYRKNKFCSMKKGQSLFIIYRKIDKLSRLDRLAKASEYVLFFTKVF